MHDHRASRRARLGKRGHLGPFLACGVAAVAMSANAAPAQAPSVAQPEAARPGPDEVIVVTASRKPRSLADTLGTVSVITAEEIAARSPTSVVDVLRGTPGLYVDQPGGRGSRASIFVRGLDPNQVVILIDGIRVNDPTNNRGGSFDFSTLDVYAVERIEIARGPLSAIHGSDALGGAINIITRRGGDEDQARVKLEGGRFGFVRANGGVRGRRGPFDFALSGAYGVDPDDASRGRFEGGSLYANLGAALPTRGELRAVLRFSDSESSAFPDNSGGEEFALIRKLEDRDVQEFTTGFTFHQPLIPKLDLQLAGSYYHRREERSSPGIALSPVPPEDTTDRYQQYEIRLQGDATLPAGFGAIAGGDVRWENGKSDSVFDFGIPVDASWKTHRVVGGPFLDVYWSSPWGLRIEAALRVELNDADVDTQALPRVGLLYPLPWLPLELRVNWGQGFKLPSLYALNNGLVGDEGLKPEESDGYDVSLDGRFFDERLWLGVTWFEIKVDDLIDFEFDPILGPRLVNRDKVETRGIELHAQAEPLGGVLLDGNLTYTDTEIIAPSGVDDAELLRRPKWRGLVAVEWDPHQSFGIRLQALLVGSVKDASFPTGPVTLDAWERIDLAAHWQPLEWLTISLGIENLLDQDYEQAAGFPSPRIRPRAGLEIRQSR